MMSRSEAVGQGMDVTHQGHGVRMQNLINPPLIKSDTAIKLAEVMLRDRWGDQRADEQLPLQIEDKSMYWRVLGGGLSAQSTFNSVNGRFCMLIRKMDGLVIDIGIFHGPGGLPE